MIHWERLAHQAALPFLVGAAVLAAWAWDHPASLLLAPAAALAVAFSVRRLHVRLQTSCDEACSLNDQLLQSQKLAALGELSSGIAHEINNPLAIIRQEVELAGLLLNQPDVCQAPAMAEIRDSLDQIGLQVGRCKEITHKMLSFSRRMTAVKQRTDLNRLVEDMVLLVEKEAGLRGVALVRDYREDLPAVVTDPQLMRQVVLNLLNNAVQSIEGRGTITVSTSADSGRVLLAIRDTGCGIPKEDLSRIFNPFFTTKPPGRGTGLGLSICLKIVEKLGGIIRVESEPGVGSTFAVSLPEAANPKPDPAG